ncbi:MAG: hypothetical protein RL113_299 [Pseudomonadota bacterium]
MRKIRPGFTIIEVLISVIILSLAIIPILKVHTDNHKEIVYITERNKRALQDSLYLDQQVLRYHDSNKTAYDLLLPLFKLKEDQSRTLLKQNHRVIQIPEAIEVNTMEEEGAPSAIFYPVILRGDYLSRYYHLSLEGF